jgi:hypothetical protein
MSKVNRKAIVAEVDQALELLNRRAISLESTKEILDRAVKAGVITYTLDESPEDRVGDVYYDLRVKFLSDYDSGWPIADDEE